MLTVDASCLQGDGVPRVLRVTESRSAIQLLEQGKASAIPHGQE